MLQLNWFTDTKKPKLASPLDSRGRLISECSTDNKSELYWVSVSIRPVLIIISLLLTFESASVEVSVMDPSLGRVGKRQIVRPLYVHCWQSLAPFHPALPLKLTGSSTSFLSRSFEENRNGRLTALPPAHTHSAYHDTAVYISGGRIDGRGG